jgi:hypothetical protein
LAYQLLAAGIALEVGCALASSGLKKILPEVAKLLDEPYFESVSESINPELLVARISKMMQYGRVGSGTKRDR